MEEKKRILITGGSGFIGTNLVEFYLEKGWDVLSLDSASPRNEKHKICFRQVDILNRQDLLQAFKDFPKFPFFM
jgi:nucleoside-diphosphate-sugar epimerase